MSRGGYEFRVRLALIGFSWLLTSFEPHPGEVPDEQHFVRKPADTTAGGRHIESEPARDLSARRDRPGAT